MKILFDSQCFDMQKFGGISRYFCEIIKNFSRNDEYILPRTYSQNEYLKQSKLVNLVESSFPGKKFIDSLKNKFFLTGILRNREESIKALRNQDFDIFHPTYFNPYFLEYIGQKPFVITVHDMIHELYPEFFKDADKIIKNKKLLAEKAAKIIAVSNKTKEDLVNFYGSPFADKTEVVYHGSSLKTPDSARDNVDFKTQFGRYFLYTGTRNIYKNCLPGYAGRISL